MYWFKRVIFGNKTKNKDIEYTKSKSSTRMKVLCFQCPYKFMLHAKFEDTPVNQKDHGFTIYLCFLQSPYNQN